NTDRFIRKRVRAKGTRPTADIPLADRYQARADAFILQPRFLWARYYLPSLRDSDASTLRTSDWEIPNCLAMREGVIPALKAARTALTWPRVNATLGSSGCRQRTPLCGHMGCRSNYWRSCERLASTLQLMAGSRKKPLQVPVVQLFERVGKVSRQHVSRRQFFGVAHGRSGQA